MPSRKPLLIYDGRCGFCKIWVDYWRRLTGSRVEYAASQDVSGKYTQILPQAFAEAVQLVRTDGSVASGAQAVFETLGMERLYQSSSVIRAASEAFYRFIAQRRGFFYHVTRLTFGRHIEPTRFASTQWIFVRLLALIYAIAFASMGVQIRGLIGSQGIEPLTPFLHNVALNVGVVRYLAIPTIFWWGSDDTSLVGICIVGAALSALLIVTGFRRGFFERAILVMLFVLYLSVDSGGQDFFSFQWDSLLLEAGFLAIFLGRSRIVPWLFRWLVFRLYFLSGSVKLLSQDLTWRNLTALSYHYYTQPLPTIVAWYMAQLPAWFQRASTLFVLVVEIAVPFLIFTPRQFRKFAAACMVILQVFIFLTGNYTFFNLLTMALCLFLLDDYALERFVPERVRVRLAKLAAPGRRAHIAAVALAIVIVTLGLTRISEAFRGDSPAPLRAVVGFLGPLNIVNGYGLFSIMTTMRTEIVVEGSNDGENWLPYEFRYKPGDLYTAPRWVAPHQPRLDWQMWFAALGNYRSTPWFVNFTVRLLEGSPQVLALLAHNPFPENPPKYVRAMAYAYTFADWQTHRRTGAWWKREPEGVYLPPSGLKAPTPGAH